MTIDRDEFDHLQAQVQATIEVVAAELVKLRIDMDARFSGLARNVANVGHKVDQLQESTAERFDHIDEALADILARLPEPGS